MYSPSNLLSDQGQKSRLTPLVAPQVQSMMCREVQCRNVAMGYIFGKLFWVCLRFQLTNSKFSTVKQFFWQANTTTTRRTKKTTTKTTTKVTIKSSTKLTTKTILGRFRQWATYYVCCIYLSECFKIKKKKTKKKSFFKISLRFLEFFWVSAKQPTGS